MKTILTTDKANKPYGYPQLDGAGNISSSININGTASFATNASTALSAVSASHAVTSISSISSSYSTYAANGTQWTTSGSTISYGNGDVIIGGTILAPGLVVNVYQPVFGMANNEAQLDAIIAGGPFVESYITPNLDSVSYSTHTGIDQNFYALDILGYITIPNTDTYYFGLNSDDASDAFVNNIKVSDYYGLHGGGGVFASNRYPISLAAGTYPVRVRLQEQGGGDFVTLYYSLDNSNFSIVPDSWLSYGTISSANLIVGNNIDVTGSLNANSITGSLFGTASWAEYAITASYALNGGGGAPIDTSSFATTGSNIFKDTQTIEGNIFMSGSLNGSGSVAYGYNVLAIGDYSHAEGGFTQAIGNYSHAEGYYTATAGEFSHAEGGQTQAIGDYSHAEGIGTQAIGNYSHAEGVGTQAIGSGSHTEGIGTQAIGDYSHAEGTNIIIYPTPVIDITTLTQVDFDFASYAVISSTTTEIIVSGDQTGAQSWPYTLGNLTVYSGVDSVNVNFSYYSIPTIDGAAYDNGSDRTTFTISNLQSSYQNVEIFNLIASGSYSHAEGFGNTSLGLASHAEGYHTQANGNFSHAEGVYTQAIGYASHAEGNNTQASGSYSHAEGVYTQAIGEGSHAEGNNTQAIGVYSHAGGSGTIASGSYQTVIGTFNAQGNTTDLFVIGNGTYAGDRRDIFTVSTSSATINGILTLTPQHPLPSGVPTGSFAVSSSIPPRPYMWDGSSWYAL